MFLTLFYMMATWMQAWRLTSLKARLAAALAGPDTTRPTIMFYIKPTEDPKIDEGNKSLSRSPSRDGLSSRMCSNQALAILGDLLWFHGDKRLCIIYPQPCEVPCSLKKIVIPVFSKNVIISDRSQLTDHKSVYKKSMSAGGSSFREENHSFPCVSQSYGRAASLNDNTKMHVLIEADVKTYHPLAYAKATRLEDYGKIITWTIDKDFAAIIETDLDHMTKLSIALMYGKCFINNGLLLTRVESIAVGGKPCVCNCDEFGRLRNDNKLVGKAQWDAHIKTLKIFSSAARHVAQHNTSLEIEELPGVVISPGNQPITLHIPTILEMKIPLEGGGHKSPGDLSGPSTPPPTPSSLSALENETATRISHKLSQLAEQHSAESLFASVPSLDSPSTICTTGLNEPTELVTPEASKDFQGSISFETASAFENMSSTASITKTPQRMFSTHTSHFSPSKKPPAKFNSSVKPPNILIYADSTVARENIKDVLGLTLNKDKYTIYTLSSDEARKDIWMDQTVLVIVCGNVGAEISGQLVEYMVRGGQLLALCSDTLHTLLPSFKTAEVREHELVRFSYGKWKHVQMMHHIFCYQASPSKSRFSQDHEDSRTTAPHTPVSADVRDRSGKSHTFHVKVLGTEETWHTPSILLANLPESGGRAVFSQIHLEADPSQYEFEESKFNALKQSNATRLEIFSDLLTTHFGMDVNTGPRKLPTYSPGYFLGRHELKLEMLDRLKDKMKPNDIYKTAKLELQFCGRTTKPMPACASLLPIMVHQCPDNFSTVEYFENLKSKELGRLVVYADIMTSSMDVVAGCELHHGLAVIPRQQTAGQGRHKNVWLSPLGCAMFTMQLHIPLNSELGDRLSILQHLVVVATVSAVKSIPGYENIDLRLKWPNDIYAGSATKIGGLIVTTLVESSIAICNIGLGVNLSNEVPTCSINDVIAKYNEQKGAKLPKLSYERFLALVFTELENLLLIVQGGNMAHLFELYYNYWMHTDAEITVQSADGTLQEVQILGIDRFGFLEVKGKNGNIFTVHPDDNSFDMLKGLIAPIAK